MYRRVHKYKVPNLPKILLKYFTLKTWLTQFVSNLKKKETRKCSYNLNTSWTIGCKGMGINICFKIPVICTYSYFMTIYKAD